RSINPGLRASKLLSLAVNPPLNGYSAPATRAFFKNLQQTLGELPGVQSVAVSRVRLLDGDWSSSTVTVAGYRTKDGEDVEPWRNEVGPGYFETMGIPLLAGREFSPADEREMIPDEMLTLDWNKPADRERIELAD